MLKLGFISNSERACTCTLYINTLFQKNVHSTCTCTQQYMYICSSIIKIVIFREGTFKQLPNPLTTIPLSFVCSIIRTLSMLNLNTALLIAFQKPNLNRNLANQEHRFSLNFSLTEFNSNIHVHVHVHVCYTVTFDLCNVQFTCGSCVSYVTGNALEV